MTPEQAIETLRETCDSYDALNVLVHELERLREAEGDVGIWRDSSGAYCERMVAAETERDELKAKLRIAEADYERTYELAADLAVDLDRLRKWLGKVGIFVPDDLQGKENDGEQSGDQS